MIVIKIIFIIMLLVPIIILMRHMLTGLSSESPAQTDPDVPVGRKISHRSKSRSSTAKKSGTTNKDRTSGKGRTKTQNSTRVRTKRDPARGEKPVGTTKRGSTYTPRQPEKWQRSERVPFGETEGYHVEPPQNRNKETADAPAENKKTPAVNRKNRSAKSPTKRQLRKNRERARKRDLKRRKKEQNNQGR